MSTLIKNSRIITAEQEYTGDVFIEQEKVAVIGPKLPVQADRVIDASGKYVIPGGVDAHTHLDMPGSGTVSSDDFETGTRAAAFGGTTCILDFSIQARGTKMREAFDCWRRKAEGMATVDYAFHMVITDLPDAELEDMNDMVREGISSFKLFTAYPATLMVDDATIFKALRKTSENGGLVFMHAENGPIIDILVKKAVEEGETAPVFHALTRPAAAEAEAVNRSIALAEIAGVPICIAHVSSNDALQRIAEARSRGVRVFAETCPQYLFLSVEDLERPDFEGAKFVLTPPLRPKWHQQKLWEGLTSNNLQFVSTDHCPYLFKGQKDAGKDVFTKIPNGGPGIENRMQLLFEGGVNQKRIGLKRWVEISSTNPAKLFGLYPRKGTIAVGSDADIVVWDPNKGDVISAQTHHMRVDYSMYEGFKVTGKAEKVFSRGELIVDGDTWLGKPGRGQYLKREPFAEAWR